MPARMQKPIASRRISSQSGQVLLQPGFGVPA